MSLATLAIAQAKAAMQRYGCAVALSHVSVGTGPDSTGDVTTAANTWGLLDASSLQGLGFKFGSDLVQAGDCKLTIPGGLAFAPAPGDTLTAAGKSWTVISVRPLYVGSAPATYELLVRS